MFAPGEFVYLPVPSVVVVVYVSVPTTVVIEVELCAKFVAPVLETGLTLFVAVGDFVVVTVAAAGFAVAAVVVVATAVAVFVASWLRSVVVARPVVESAECLPGVVLVRLAAVQLTVVGPL